MTGPWSPSQPLAIGPVAWIRPGSLALAVAIGGVTVGLVAGSPALAVGGPLAVGCTWHRRRAAAASARRRAAADRTIELVAVLLQHLKAGGSLSQSLRAATSGRVSSSRAGSAPAAGMGPDEVLSGIRAAADAGAGLELALARAAGTRGSGAGPGSSVVSGAGRKGAHGSDVALLVLTLLVLVQRGGSALPALERLDDTLRSARWVEQETAAQASQATASALALAALPALFVTVLALLDADLARFYAFHPLGAACLAGSAALAYAGWWWMHHIVTASLGGER